MARRYLTYINKTLNTAAAESWRLYQNHYQYLTNTAIRIANDVPIDKANGQVVIEKDSFTSCTAKFKWVAYQIVCSSCTISLVTYNNVSGQGNPILNIYSRNYINSSLTNVWGCQATSTDSTVEKGPITYRSELNASMTDMNITYSTQPGSIGYLCGAWILLLGKDATGHVKRYKHFHSEGNFLTGLMERQNESSSNKIWYMNWDDAYFVNCTAHAELFYTRPNNVQAIVNLKNIRIIQTNCTVYFSAWDPLTRVTFNYENCVCDTKPNGSGTIIGADRITITTPITYPLITGISIIPEYLTADLEVFIAKAIDYRWFLCGIFFVPMLTLTQTDGEDSFDSAVKSLMELELKMTK